VILVYHYDMLGPGVQAEQLKTLIRHQCEQDANAIRPYRQTRLDVVYWIGKSNLNAPYP
jgi:hypothetical protein